MNEEENKTHSAGVCLAIMHSEKRKIPSSTLSVVVIVVVAVSGLVALWIVSRLGSGCSNISFRSESFSDNRMHSVLQRLAARQGGPVIVLVDAACAAGKRSEKINLETGSAWLSLLRRTDPSQPLNVILHTAGGDTPPALQMALALARHPGRVTVQVPYYAFSAGTILALAANDMLLDPNAVLGPIDPQIHVPNGCSDSTYSVAAGNLQQLLQAKPAASISDATLMSAQWATKWAELIPDFLRSLVRWKRQYSEDAINRIIDQLAVGKVPHSFPITPERARQLGMNVTIQPLDPLVYELVDGILARKCGGERPTVFSSLP